MLKNKIRLCVPIDYIVVQDGKHFYLQQYFFLTGMVYVT
jgi:hypothetical protein